jgi:hypothetical protein
MFAVHTNITVSFQALLSKRHIQVFPQFTLTPPLWTFLPAGLSHCAQQTGQSYCAQLLYASSSSKPLCTATVPSYCMHPAGLSHSAQQNRAELLYEYVSSRAKPTVHSRTGQSYCMYPAELSHCAQQNRTELLYASSRAKPLCTAELLYPATVCIQQG